MKLSKLYLVLVMAVVVVAALATSVSAYTSADLAAYITGTHTITGNVYQLKNAQQAEVKAYLNDHPVTDAQAAQIKALLDQAKSKAEATGKISLKDIPEATKSEIVDLVKQAGAIAGVSVSVDTANNTVTLVGIDGSVIISGSYLTDGTNGITKKLTGGTPVGGGAPANNSAANTNGGVKTFVYTGSNNAIFALLAVVLVVAVSTVVVKKANA